jgi:hypothetical protein
MVNPRARGFNPIPAVGVNKYHESSDVDSGSEAQHHTLGKGAMQAAPGNHDHNDIFSHQHWTIFDTQGVNFFGDYVAQYVQIGTFVHARFFGGVLNTVAATDYIAVNVPVPPNTAGLVALDTTCGDGAIHNPGIYRKSCIMHWHSVGGRWFVVWQPSDSANAFVTATSIVPNMSGDELMSFNITYEAAEPA